MADDRTKINRSLCHAEIERFFHELRTDPKTRQVRWPLHPGAPSVMIDDDDLPEPVSESASVKGRRRVFKRPRTALIEATFDASTTKAERRRVLRARGLAIVILVPSPGWVGPVVHYLSDLIDAETFGRDGLSRPKEDGNNSTAGALAAGRNVLGVSHSDRLLPSLLVACADIRIDIARPDAATIARAMRMCLRGRLKGDPPRHLASGLDFDEIISAMREGSTPTEAVARMQALVRGRAAVGVAKYLPRLEDALFYGEARDWGLALAEDIASVRRGEADFSQISRAAVFFGPPGTGKTVLARMIAAAAGLPIVEASIAELFATSTGYLDGVIKAQRAVFARATAMAPCVLFIDEIDAMPDRAKLSDRGRDWWMPVVDDFLLLVASAPPGVIMLAATNLIEDLDAALFRPGRFERQIEIRAPATAEGLAGILRFHLRRDLAEVDLVRIAQFGLGATAAQAAEWVRTARRTARVAKRLLTEEDLLAQIAPSDDRSQETLTRDAFHEAAHAVLGLVLGVQSIDHISIVKKGATGGHVRFAGLREVETSHRDRLEEIVLFLLAGRAAEVVFLGRATAGAGGDANSDLAKATRLVAAVHFSLGLAGSLVYRGDPQDLEDALRFDPILRDTVDADLRRLTARAEALVRQYRPAIEAVAAAVLAKRVLAGPEIKALFDAACRAPGLVPEIDADARAAGNDAEGAT